MPFNWLMMLPALAPLAAKAVSGLTGPRYPKFDYNYKLPEMDWDKFYNAAMARPRREASRYAQTAAARTLPGGPRQAALTNIGRDLTNVANRTSADIEKERMSYIIPWAQRQYLMKREDALAKYGMARQDIGDIFKGLGMGFGQAYTSGNEDEKWKMLLQLIRSGNLFGSEPGAMPRPELPSGYWRQ